MPNIPNPNIQANDALISRLARTAVVTFLSDESYGFNASLAAICANYSIPSQAFLINFASGSQNFFQGYYMAKDLVTSSSVTFPLITLYTLKSANQNNEKFHMFSGSVMIGLDTYISFPQSRALTNTDDLTDAVEATYYNLFNSAPGQVNWGSVTYNGDLYVNRGPVSQAGNNWLQYMQARLSVDVDT